MNKNLIALAVTAALVVPAAASAADVEVYGKARASVGFVMNGQETDGQSDSEISITSHDSYVGVKGSEDLGNGLSAVYQVESMVDLDNGGGSFATRNSFVGLSGGFGTVLLGNHDTPYKLATKKMDVFSDTHADYTGAGVNKTHDARSENVLAYVSPKMGSVSFIGAYVSDFGGDDDLDGTDPDDHMSAISLAGLLDLGQFSGSLAFQKVDNVSGDDSYDATKLGLTYNVNDAAAVNFIFETTELGDNDQDNIYLSGSFGISDATTLKAAFGMRGEQGGADDTEGTYFAIGASTMMSKSTELYAQYTAVDNDAGGNAALKHVTAAGDADGTEASALTVGINVAFSSK